MLQLLDEFGDLSISAISSVKEGNDLKRCEMLSLKIRAFFAEEIIMVIFVYFLLTGLGIN